MASYSFHLRKWTMTALNQFFYHQDSLNHRHIWWALRLYHWCSCYNKLFGIRNLSSYFLNLSKIRNFHSEFISPFDLSAGRNEPETFWSKPAQILHGYNLNICDNFLLLKKFNSLSHQLWGAFWWVNIQPCIRIVSVDILGDQWFTFPTYNDP